MSLLFINFIFFISLCWDGVVCSTGSDGVFMASLFDLIQPGGIDGMVFSVEESGVSIATVGKVYNITSFIDFKYILSNTVKTLHENIVLLLFFLVFLIGFICFNVGYFSSFIRFFYHSFLHFNLKMIVFLSHFSFVSKLFNKMNSLYLLLFGQRLNYRTSVLEDNKPRISIYWHDHYIASFSKTFVSDFIVNLNYLVDDSKQMTGVFHQCATNSCILLFCKDHKYDYMGSDYRLIYKMDTLDLGKWFVTKDDLDHFILLIYCIRFGYLFLLEDIANIWSKLMLPFTSFASYDFKYCARFFVLAHWVDFPYRKLFLQFLFSLVGIVFFFLKTFSTSLYFFYSCLFCFSVISFYFFLKPVQSSFVPLSFFMIARKFVSLFKRYTLIYFLLFLFPALYGFVGFTFFLFSLISEYLIFFYKHYYDISFVIER